MNTLDALFARQVPTRGAGGGTAAAPGFGKDETDPRQGGFSAALTGHAHRSSHHAKDGKAEEADESGGTGDAEASGEGQGKDGAGKGISRFSAMFAAVASMKGQDEEAQAGTAVDAEDMRADPDIEAAMAALASAKADQPLAGDNEPAADADASAEADANTPKSGRSARMAALANADDPNKTPRAVAETRADPKADGQAADEKPGRANGVDVAAQTPAGEQAARGRQASGIEAAVAAQAQTQAQPLLRQVSGQKPDVAAGARDAQPDAGLAPTADGEVATGEKPDGARRRADWVARSAQTAARPRDDNDGALKGVRVMENRQFAGASMSENAASITRALSQEGGLLSQAGQADRSAAAQSAANTSQAGFTTALNRGQTLHTLKIQLQPLDLGQVTAVLRLVDGELSVQLKVQSAEAYRQLSDDSDSIVKSLRAQGYGVEHVTVQHVPNERSANAQAQQPGFTSGQQFQAGNGQAQTAAGNGGQQRGSGNAGSSNQSGDLAHEAATPSHGGSRGADGVYL